MKVRSLLIAFLLTAAPAALFAQVSNRPANKCYTDTLSDTSTYVPVFSNNGASLVMVNTTYYTTGGPASVSAQIYAGNFPQATSNPLALGAAKTNTTSADLGQQQGNYAQWYLKLATLTGGTNPTIVARTCISLVNSTIGISGLQSSAVYSDNGTTGTIATGKALAATDADSVTVGGVILPQVMNVTYRCAAAATCATAPFFIADAAYQITAVNAVWATAESTASNLRIQVEKLTGTTAPASGTALLTNNTNAGISIKATANTVTAGTLSGTVGNLQLAAGNRLGIKFEAGPTEGANVLVTVTLKRI